MNINIHPLNDHHKKAVSLLRVNDEQTGFVETIDTILNNINDQVHGHVITQETEVKETKVIGFFLIDTSYSSHYQFSPVDSLGLRSFFIDERFQGHGYGKATVSLLADYLATHYPSFQSVYLTVNRKNPSAKYCYEEGGFKDTGELYLGGDYGPQHIMQLPLTSQNIK